MKKIMILVTTALFLFTFSSCSDSGSSSLSADERAAIMTAAFSGSLTAVASRSPMEKAPYLVVDYSILDGQIGVTGYYYDDTHYEYTITFNNYSDSEITLNGSITFILSDSVFSMNGTITAGYQGESYSFGMNISGDGSENLTGTITVDGTVYTL